jgi:hypothetical protein
MSQKSEHKKAVKAEKQAESAAFRLMNESFLSDESLRSLLVVGAEAAGAKPAGLFVHVVENVEDGTHTEGREIGQCLGLHLTIPPKGGDALQSATELFRRIVMGWSFITNVQIGNKDRRAACCNECIAAIVKEHAPVIQAVTGVYTKQAA